MERNVMLFSVLVVFLGGCGDDGSSGESCAAFEACGGDPTGRWEIVTACGVDLVANANASQFDPPACDGAFRKIDLRASGTYEFASSGTATFNFVAQLDTDVWLTNECITAVRGMAPASLVDYCSGLESDYAQSPDLAGAMCNVEGGACTCLLTSVEQTTMASGSYTLDGTNIDDGVSLTPFCVSGDTLKTLEESPDGTTVTTLRRVAP